MKKSRRKSARSAAARRPYQTEPDNQDSSEADDGTTDGRFADEECVSYKLGIPMRDRQFPASFWIQPLRPNCNVHQPLEPPARGELLDTRTTAIRIPTPPDTNLLFSLFKILEHHRRRAAAATLLLHDTDAVRHKRPHQHRRARSRPSRRHHHSHKPVSSAVNAPPIGARLPDLVADTTHADLTGCAHRIPSTEETVQDEAASTFSGTVTCSEANNNNNNSSCAHDDGRLRGGGGGNDDDDNDNNVSSEDPYLTGHAAAASGHEMLLQAADRRRSMLMMMADRHVASSSAASGSCFSDLLSDLVVNL